MPGISRRNIRKASIISNEGYGNGGKADGLKGEYRKALATDKRRQAAGRLGGLLILFNCQLNVAK